MRTNFGKSSGFRSYLRDRCLSNNNSYQDVLKNTSIYDVENRLGSRTKRDILKVMGMVMNHNSVLVMGPERMLNLPIEDMTNKFHRIVLADLDTDTVSKALESKILDSHVRNKIDILEADVSGISYSYMDDLVNAAKSGNQDHFFSLMMEPHADFEIKHQHFDFIVSSELVNNVADLACSYILNSLMNADPIMGRQYIDMIENEHDGGMLKLGFLSMHLNLMNKLLSPDGLAYFSYVKSTSRAGRLHYTFLSDEQIINEMQKYFIIDHDFKATEIEKELNDAREKVGGYSIFPQVFLLRSKKHS